MVSLDEATDLKRGYRFQTRLLVSIEIINNHRAIASGDDVIDDVTATGPTFHIVLLES